MIECMKIWRKEMAKIKAPKNEDVYTVTELYLPENIKNFLLDGESVKALSLFIQAASMMMDTALVHVSEKRIAHLEEAKRKKPLRKKNGI